MSIRLLQRHFIVQSNAGILGKHILLFLIWPLLPSWNHFSPSFPRIRWACSMHPPMVSQTWHIPSRPGAWVGAVLYLANCCSSLGDASPPPESLSALPCRRQAIRKEWENTSTDLTGSAVMGLIFSLFSCGMWVQNIPEKWPEAHNVAFYQSIWKYFQSPMNPFDPTGAQQPLQPHPSSTWGIPCIPLQVMKGCYYLLDLLFSTS